MNKVQKGIRYLQAFTNSAKDASIALDDLYDVCKTSNAVNSTRRDFKAACFDVIADIMDYLEFVHMEYNMEQAKKQMDSDDKDENNE